MKNKFFTRKFALTPKFAHSGRSMVIIMKICDKLITPESDYFTYSPSRNALHMFFYPLCVGHFTYKSGYYLYRDTYNSFLLMYIKKGHLTLEIAGNICQIPAGYFALVNCYQPHAYYTHTGCECIWCHFDGPTALAHYESILSHLGNAFYLTDPYPLLKKMTAIYETFRNGTAVKEPLMSKYLNDILTSLLLYTPADVKPDNSANVAGELIAYMNEHFQEPLTIARLADQAGLSQYHFIRIFKRETGFTPHEYLVRIRINTAKYLLKNSKLPMKEICFQTGFSHESVFCTAFKKHLGVTPLQYRSLEVSE